MLVELTSAFKHVALTGVILMPILVTCYRVKYFNLSNYNSVSEFVTFSFNVALYYIDSFVIKSNWKVKKVIPQEEVILIYSAGQTQRETALQLIGCANFVAGQQAVWWLVEISLSSV